MSDGKDGTSHAVALVIAALMVAGIGWLIWRSFQTEIRTMIVWVRYAQMWVATLFLDNDYTVVYDGTPYNYQDVMVALGGLDPSRVSNEMLGIISRVALAPYFYPFIATMGSLGLWALFRGPGTEHRSRLDLDHLIARQSKIFPIVAPFVAFNPSSAPPRPPGCDVPADLPLFAEALDPEEWIAYNSIPFSGKFIDEDVAFRAFSKQLGVRWQGALKLAPYKQILLAAFCLKSNRQRAESDDMLSRLALCWSQSGLSLSKDSKLLSEARAILRKDSVSGKVLRLCNQHAWETTVLLRALSTAREEGGVLAPSQFVWLRAYDRALWYPLNNLGRQSYHMEAIGAMAHYKAEKLSRRPIPRPKMGDPVKSLVEYMNSSRARAVPHLDYSKSKKKRGVAKPKAA